ncbi:MULTISPECIES: NAD(P)/FAD-dependent oxidoreductase [Pelosinus]|uniref:FAD dependent oxidoreductase n=1 Tax=Pelosinus fermentans B4 TaxID=1149862 RepID=I9LHK2_9FIRM|nr:MULTISPECIES: NAD(P)/FAD-dependent oxidoreductase [Pelosinus]EIW19841.1 FAD dependent oxidoreductase [Pelosinus fermentans B4]EIW21302.1 FAD dependent oxidoreductase [Pelosinus fermentans A11]OAM94995.1 FAD dependent oxidoreductase [Pelosinus fermentans DSM 17108]SDR21727.1 glycerol-3-phosphate dehydrogenase [Pelosinus fermentans]
MYDICIIGAGVVGTNIARELSKYQIRVCLVEKEEDVSCGASKANSGIVHGGYSDEPGTLKAELCVKGNRMYEQLNKELNFGYRETGSVVLAFRDEDMKTLEKLYQYGIKNGVGGLAIIDGEKVRELEPYVSKEVKAALYCRNAGVTSPYEFVIALAENAITNGVELKLNTAVVGIEKVEDYFKVITNKGEIQTQYIINAAGIYCDKISSLIGIDDFHIIPRRGQYVLLDKEQNYLANSVIFQVPTELGKGILVTTTYHGNLMVGPNAEEISDKDDVGTTEDVLENIVKTARMSVPDFDMKQAITSFAGNRPISSKKDWIIEESRVAGFINLIGIDSPGLTASPAIALKVAGLLKQAGLELRNKKDFMAYRKPIIQVKDKNFKGDINSTNPDEHIICRCEQVTETEIIDALHRNIAIKSIDAIKRRTRAGMGKCQSGFCRSRVKEIIARELHIPVEEVTQRGKDSPGLPERAKRGKYIKL